MVFARIACLNLLVLWSLGIRTAHAGGCNSTAPHYQLASDTVEWRTRIVSGQSCVQALRFHSIVDITTINLITPPQFAR
jgi:hypothetical protein